MTRPFRDSPIEQGMNPVRVEEGRIVNVNLRRFTVDVRTRESQRTYLDIPWSSPYFHFARGEGFCFVPEVGAKVKVCRPSDSDPFVLTFITPFERIPLSDEAAPPPQGTASNPTGGQTEISYRAGRPRMEQGDILLRTRDGNELFLHRGGVVEIGATKLARRFYFPVLNFIRDLCENYQLWGAGGSLSWLVTRSDESPDDEAYAVLSIAAREAAQHAMASVALRMGHLDDSLLYELVIGPQAINPTTFESEAAVYKIQVDREGTVTCSVKKDVSLTVEGKVTADIEGEGSISFGSNLSLDVGSDLSIKASGRHKLEAASSTEQLDGSKIIDSSSILLGSSSAWMGVVLASPALIAFLAGHTHPVTGPVTGPPTPALAPNQYQARKVRGE